VCSSLHLMLVTCERLIAIRFTVHYPDIVITRNIKVAVISFWVFSISQVIVGLIVGKSAIRPMLNLLVALVLFSCVLFIASAYAIL